AAGDRRRADGESALERAGERLGEAHACEQWTAHLSVGYEEAKSTLGISQPAATSVRSVASVQTICSRPGPTPISITGTPVCSLMNARYSRAASGRSETL